jgi:hypothetical protein
VKAHNINHKELYKLWVELALISHTTWTNRVTCQEFDGDHGNSRDFIPIAMAVQFIGILSFGLILALFDFLSFELKLSAK